MDQFTQKYVDGFMADLIARNPGEKEFHQAVNEVLVSVAPYIVEHPYLMDMKILERIVEEKWIYGCVSMPSNVFATTGTNVSVLFFDKSGQNDKVILIDASKLGEEYKEGNNQKRRLRPFEVDQIVNTFQNKESVLGIVFNECLRYLMVHILHPTVFSVTDS